MSPIQGWMEVIDQPIYDTLHTLAPRSRKRRDREALFVVPYGMMHETKTGLRVKTFEDTNMLISAALDAPKTFRVKHIRCALLGRRLFPCDSRYYRDLWLEFEINRRTMWQGPGWRCVDPAATMINPTSWLALENSDRAELVSLLRRPLDPPIEIRAHECFSVTATFGEAWFEAWYAAPERLVVLLEGNLSLAIV